MTFVGRELRKAQQKRTSVGGMSRDSCFISKIEIQFRIERIILSKQNCIRRVRQQYCSNILDKF